MRSLLTPPDRPRLPACSLPSHVHVVTSMQDLVVPVSVSFVAGGLAADPPSINLMLTLDPSALVACPRPALCRLALLADAVSALAPEGSPLRLPSAGAAAAAPPARSGVARAHRRCTP